MMYHQSSKRFFVQFVPLVALLIYYRFISLKLILVIVLVEHLRKKYVLKKTANDCRYSHECLIIV